MAREKILVVEDEENILEAIKYSLTSEGFDVYGAEDGEKGLEMARELAPDLVVLDVMLPKIDGFEVCRMLRKDMDLPVFMLSAKAEEIDRVVGLEIGADDYITKPFSMRELLLRIKAILKRNPSEDSDKVISYENVELFSNKREVLIDKKSLSLTKTEFDFLECLMKNFDQVLSRDQLLEYSKFDYLESDDRVVDVHIKNLRKKLENLKSKLKIITVRSMGYRSTIG